jgi:predicted ATPase
LITRLFVSQYKCLVNFELKLGQINLLTGRNGSGKTSVFDVLESIQRIIVGQSVPSVEFPTATSLTAWLSDANQRFEIEVEGNDGHYLYQLELRHSLTQLKCVVSREVVTFNERKLLSFDGRTVELVPGDGSEAITYPQNGNTSPLSTITESSAHDALIWLRKRLGSKVHVHSPDAPRIGNDFIGQPRPNRTLSNLTEWLAFESSVNDALYGEFVDYLVEEVIIGLRGIMRVFSSTPRKGDFQYWFNVSPFNEGSPGGYALAIEQLSDGQRMLIAIYALAILVAEPGTTVCIEEPDNYLGLNEIQPWLAFLRNLVEERNCQCLVISHHPEAYNYLAPENGIWFERDEAREVHAASFNETGNVHLTPAELVARGWR